MGSKKKKKKGGDKASSGGAGKGGAGKQDDWDQDPSIFDDKYSDPNEPKYCTCKYVTTTNTSFCHYHHSVQYSTVQPILYLRPCTATSTTAIT